MTTALVIVIVIVIVLIAVLLRGVRKSRERNLQRRRVAAGGHREEAQQTLGAADRDRAERGKRRGPRKSAGSGPSVSWRPESLEQEASRQSSSAEESRRTAREHEQRADELDPDKSGT